MTMSSDNTQRTLLGKQPARILLIDLSPPFSHDVGDDLCDSLDNMFALACNFTGPSRIPFFGVMAIREYPELLLPFSYVRNNYPRIQAAICDVRSLIHEIDQADKINTNFEPSLTEACTQYRRQLQSTLQTGGFCHQLEIVLVTCQKARLIHRLIETAVSSMDLEHIKRIQILSLTCNDILPLDELMLTSSQASSTSDHSGHSSVTSTGLVEMVNLEPDLLCIQNYLNGWMLDTGTDSEHMHIILPHADSSGNGPVVVKCDLHERILHPAQLPFYNQFTVHSDSSGMKMVFPSTSKAMGMTVPIYRLHVTSLVPITAVCDSLVFGMPMIVHPTACWKIDWDDLEKNQQNFKALCQLLTNKDMAMVAQLQCSNQHKTTRNNNNLDLQPAGNFALIPAANGTLLVKCLAVQELMLPYNVTGNQTEEPAEECVNLITESLDQIELIQCYNPLNHPSNLYECLKNIGRKPTQGQRQTKRLLEKTSSSSTINRLVTSKSSKSARKDDSSLDLADTPLSKRLISKTQGRGAYKRSLYSEGKTTYLPELMFTPDEDNVEICNIGQTRHMKPVVSFPTSL